MDGPRTIRVEFKTKRDAARIDAMPGERLLFAGLRSGLDLPYECASGVCGSCQAQVLTGAPAATCNLFPQAPAARNLSPDRVLMCQTAVQGNVELRLFSRLRTLSDRQIRPRHFCGRVDRVDRVARNTYVLSVFITAPFPYQPGQFAMLSVDGVSGYRAYSMTRGQQRHGCLEFVIRTKPGGRFSEWLCHEAHANPAVSVFGPLGRAVLPESPTHLFAVAGGTGIAGILSILEQALLDGRLETQYATVVFGIRTLADAFFLDRLSAWAEIAQGHLDVIVALSDERVDEIGGPLRLIFASGLVLDVARKRVAHALRVDTSFFLAGPPVVVDGGVAMLCDSFGVAHKDIRYDRFQ